MTYLLRPADRGDLAACQALLQRCALPLGGLEHAFPRGYVVADADGAVIGCAGVEGYGEAGLLRSVAVAPEARGLGLGEQLTRSRIDHARDQRLVELWLLTTTAPTYFSRLGFGVIDRGNAPAQLAASAEFRDVCPASATCMNLRLGA